jgi:hypothetical protein
VGLMGQGLASFIVPPQSAVTVQIEPDYFQFYARREGAEWASGETPSAGYEEHLWSNGEFVTIGTARKFGTTAVVLEAWDRPPDQPDALWQHVAEVSLKPGGPLEVFSWNDDSSVVVVPIDEGWVRLRVLWAGLVAGRYEGMDDDGTSDEHLMLQAWGAQPSPSAVIRWWSGWVLPPPSDMSRDGRRQVEGLEAVLDRRSTLRTLTDPMTFRHPGPMPGGGKWVHAVLFDPASRMWWVDGTDIRRTLREITQEEAEQLMSGNAAP